LFACLLAQIEQFEKEKAEKKNKGDVEPDENMLEMLVAMGIERLTAVAVLQATKNAGVDEAFEYINKRGNNIPKTGPEKSKKSTSKPRFVPLELQRLFSELQLIDAVAVSTQGASYTFKYFIYFS
jgi:hypothetical protein